jgi:hypothetical protein
METRSMCAPRVGSEFERDSGVKHYVSPLLLVHRVGVLLSNVLIYPSAQASARANAPPPTFPSLFGQTKKTWHWQPPAPPAPPSPLLPILSLGQQRKPGTGSRPHRPHRPHRPRPLCLFSLRVRLCLSSCLSPCLRLCLSVCPFVSVCLFRSISGSFSAHSIRTNIHKHMHTLLRPGAVHALFMSLGV